MAKAKKTITVYVVRRVGWEYNDEFNYRIEEPSDANSIRSFLTHEKAETHRQQLEREARGEQNPFDYGGVGDDLADHSTLSFDEFGSRMERVGLEGGSRLTWWDWFNGMGWITPEQRHAVWDALDLVRFYEVVPVQVELEE